MTRCLLACGPITAHVTHYYPPITAQHGRYLSAPGRRVRALHQGLAEQLRRGHARHELVAEVDQPTRRLRTQLLLALLPGVQVLGHM